METLETLARELVTLTENPTYSDRYDLINKIIEKIRSSEDYPRDVIVEELKQANLRFFANKVASGYYGRD